MNPDCPLPATPGPSKAARIVGWILTILPAGMLLMSATMKLMQHEQVRKGFESWPAGTAIKLGIVEAAVAVIYLIPRTAVLGAILVAGYLGGATAVHVHLGQPVYIPVALGVAAWLGLYLRDPRVRQLAPLRRL
jgi:hypothetical protein